MRLVLVRRTTMRPHAWLMDAIALRADRHTTETVNRHLEKMGSERLPRGANAGFELRGRSENRMCGIMMATMPF